MADKPDPFISAQSLAVAFDDLANHAAWIHIDHDQGTELQRVTVVLGPWVFVEQAQLAANALATIHQRWRAQAAAMEGKHHG